VKLQNGSARVRFIVRRKTQAQRVTVELPENDESKITEQELLFRLNILDPGTAITEQTLQSNADVILEYLRDRGFFKAEVTYSQRPLDSETEVGVTFRVNPNAQATVSAFNINLVGFDNAKLTEKVKLQPGEPFSRERLTADIDIIRGLLRDEDFLAPILEEPRVVYDSEKNRVAISLAGKVGPTVEVEVEAEHDRVGNRTQKKLIPVKREGTLDYGAIVEGERRLENHYQEQGYFFVNVTPVCSIEPPVDSTDATNIKNDTEFLCSALNTTDLQNKKVTLKYKVDLDRQFKALWTSVSKARARSRSTRSRPFWNRRKRISSASFRYSVTDADIRASGCCRRMLPRCVRYCVSSVIARRRSRVNQGVSPDGQNLIITFVVEEGPRTIISGIDIAGNTAFSDDDLKAQLPELEGTYFSRAKIRNGQRRLSEFYSDAGYYDAKVEFSIDERVTNTATGERLFKVVYTVNNEGKKVVIDRILVTGNRKTKPEAILPRDRAPPRRISASKGHLRKRTESLRDRCIRTRRYQT
jgi:outer membrane protein assembly factor BamA